MRLGVLACALAAAGCYRPVSENNCTVRCTAAAPCSAGFACVGGLCQDPMQPCDDVTPIDAGPDLDAYEDAPIDASVFDAPMIDAPAGCYGTDLFTNCPTPPSMNMTYRQAGIIETSPGGPACSSSSSAVCLIVFSQITIEAPLKVLGSRPLVMIGTNRITIMPGGSLDASSGAGSELGAGGNWSQCGTGSNGATSTGATLPTGGGGAGGTFSGRGGFGGASANATGGTPAPNPSTMVLAPRGGCRGTDGGGSIAGAGGNGGGVIVLISGVAIDVHGSVFARGAGGAGGGPSGGGGGGGSGGLIALDAPSLVVLGALVAGGGGGGGGGDRDFSGMNGGISGPGGEPAQGGGGVVGPTGAGQGGMGSGPAGLRNGFGGETVMTLNNGGGGGGGGAGVIRLHGTLTQPATTIVPPAS